VGCSLLTLSLAALVPCCSPETDGSGFAALIGVDSDNDHSTVNNYCLAQSMVAVFFENAQYVLVAVLVDVEWRVLVNNDRRPDVRRMIYYTIATIYPAIILASGVGISQFGVPSAYGWSNNGRCKYYTLHGSGGGTKRGSYSEWLEGILQLVIGIVAGVWAHKAVKELDKQMALATNNFRRAAVKEKRGAHMRFVALGK